MVPWPEQPEHPPRGLPTRQLAARPIADSERFPHFIEMALAGHTSAHAPQ